MTDTALIATSQSTALIPSSIAEAQQVAELLAASTLVPDDYKGKPQNCYMAIQYGSEVGLSPMASLLSVCVIKGKPSLYASAKVGLVLASRQALYFHCIEATPTKATYETHRKGAPKPVRFSFTYEDAKRAELLGGMYKKWPQRMLDARAKSFLCNDVYPDILLGMPTYEDVIDIDSVDKVDVESFDAPAAIDVESQDAKPKEETNPAASNEVEKPEVTPEKDGDGPSLLDQILGCKTIEELEGLRPALATLEGVDREKALKLYAEQKKSIGTAK